MEKNYKFANVTERQLKQMGVQALADRPNAAQQYGQSGLTATQLKLWFDKLATLLSQKVNELQDAITSEEAAKYIGLALTEYKTLDDLIEGMQDGSFATDILKLMPNENALELATLQEIIYGIAQRISEIEEELERLDEDKLSKVIEAATYKRVYGVDEKGEQIMFDAAASPAGQMPLYSANGALIAKMSPIENMPGVEYPSEVINLAFMNELRKHIGAGVKFSMDPKTYIVSIDVVNIDGQVIYHTELDLPLENIIVGGTYQDGKIIFTLQNGNKIEVPVVNIVNGLVTEAKHKADIDAINRKIDASLNAYVVDVYNLLGGDYVDYS
jgi:hypothetical protein